MRIIKKNESKFIRLSLRYYSKHKNTEDEMVEEFEHLYKKVAYRYFKVGLVSALALVVLIELFKIFLF